MKNKLILKFIISIICAIILGYFFLRNYSKEVPILSDSNNISLPSVLESELMIIREDLDKYSYLSDKSKNEIVYAIEFASNKYNLPPAILHIIFQVESTYRFEIQHPQVTIFINKKPVKTYAIGLGGIVWDIWKDSLRFYGIANTFTDLYKIFENIQATGYILRTYINYEISKGTKEEEILIRALDRYYGTISPSYRSKIYKAVFDYWLLQFSKNLINKLN